MIVRHSRMPSDDDVAQLGDRIAGDHAAWINGDSSGYELHDETSTILAAFGGAGVGATEATPGQRRAVAQFKSGTGHVEVCDGAVNGDVHGSCSSIGDRRLPGPRRATSMGPAGDRGVRASWTGVGAGPPAC